MKNRFEYSTKWRAPLVIVLAVIVIVSGVVAYQFLKFNNEINSVSDNGNHLNVSITNDIGESKEERWESVFQTTEDKSESLTYTGETVKITINNGNDYSIKKWSLQLNPANECYLNGFWGGSMEVHQFRDGVEITETLSKNTSNSEIEKLDVNHYVENMMIHLLPGDYFIFHPFTENQADYVLANSKIEVAFNLYYFETLDLSEYEFSFQNDLNVSDTWLYPVMIALWILWLCALMSYITAWHINRRVVHDTKNSVSAISVMADLYLEAYMIDTKKQDIYLIKGDKFGKSNISVKLKENEKVDIQERLNKYVEDCKDIYAEGLRNFLDLSTIEERLGENSSIAMEYASASIGWCAIRIFKLKQNYESGQYIFAIQDINEERRRLQEIEESARQKENAEMIQGDFLNNTFYAMNELVTVIRNTSGVLASKLVDVEQKMMAMAINNSIEHMHLLKNCAQDLFAIEADRFVLKNEPYNLDEMIEKIKGILLPFYQGKDFEFKIDVDGTIPKNLRGDRERIMQILVVLLFSSMFITEKGFVKLSIFGRKNGNVEELIFSVRDSAVGFTEEQASEIHDVLRESTLRPLENASSVYLQIMNQILLRMNSELKMVSVYGSGSEFYFSIEQEIVNE